MPNEIKVVYESGHDDLTYGAYQPDGTVRTAAGTSVPEIGSTGYYTTDDGDIQQGDIVVLKQGSAVIGGGEYQEEVFVINPDDCKADLTSLNDISVADILAAVGVTEGGSWDLQKALKIITAWCGGNWRYKAENVYELLDAEDGATVMLEMQLSQGSPYRQITVKI